MYKDVETENGRKKKSARLATVCDVALVRITLSHTDDSVRLCCACGEGVEEGGMREERLISRASAAGAAMDASFLVQRAKPPCLAARFSPPGSTAAAARPSPFLRALVVGGLLRVCACLPPLRPVRPTQLSGRSKSCPSSRSLGFGVGAGGAAPPLSRSFCFSPRFCSPHLSFYGRACAAARGRSCCGAGSGSHPSAARCHAGRCLDRWC